MQSALFKDNLKYLCHLSPPPSSLTSTRFFPPLGPTTTAHQPDSLNAALLLALLPSSTLHPLPRRPSSPATFYLILKIQLKHYFLLMAAFLVFQWLIFTINPFPLFSTLTMSKYYFD